MEVMPHFLATQKEINKLCIYYADQWDIPPVGTNDCHYVNEDDAKTQEVLLAMQTKAKWNDKDRFRFPITGLHLRSKQEMNDSFIRQDVLSRKEIDEAIEATIEIAEKCKDFSIKKQSIYLPNVPGLEKENPDEFIYNYALKRLKELGIKSFNFLFLSVDHNNEEFIELEGNKKRVFFNYNLIKFLDDLKGDCYA